MIDDVTKSLGGISPIQKPSVPNAPQKTSESKSFGDFFSDAMKEVSSLQHQAESKIEGIVIGDGKVTPHDAAIALEKADIAFQLMTNIRTKIIRAYEEIMRTQV